MHSSHSDNRSLTAASDQLAGICHPVYEIGVADFTVDSVKGTWQIRPWTFDEVRNGFSWLRYRNRQRCDIYVRPLAPHPYSLLDDLTADALRRLHDEGFTPSVVTETSPGNFQAWLNHGEALAAEESTEVAQILADQFDADPSSADFRHFGRLAGTTNTKPKHRRADGLQPFVLLHVARPHVHSQAAALIALARERLEERKAAIEAARAAARRQPRLKLTKTLTDFHADARYNSDLHRADLAYSVYALAHGASRESVAAQLALRDLTHKGSLERQLAYVERTMNKAAEAVAGAANAR